MNTRPELSIIVPAYMEADLIESSLDQLAAYLKIENLADNTEVIVVVADSPDNTAQLAKAQVTKFKNLKVIESGPKLGKGRDVKIGVMAASADYVLFTDADLATPLHHIKPALESLKNGSNVVIGIRNLWKIHNAFSRKVNSVMANWLVRLFLLPSISDSQCGFKGFSRDAAHKLFEKLTVQGWAFDMELLVIAKAYKFKLTSMPIKDWHDPKIAGLVGESTFLAGTIIFIIL